MREALRSVLSSATKRGLDLAAAGIGLATCGLPFAAIGAAIKIESAGPVFYRGERIGRHGRPFRIFKFRSMYAAVSPGPDTTSDADPRITRVGRVLRQYKIDELPQLINVLKGEMSLVGPRPEVKWCVDLYTEEERRILSVKPGMTDWSSIRFHNEGEIVKRSGYDDPDRAYVEIIRPEKLRLQLKYVEERSLKVDLRILLETFRTLLSTRLGEAQDLAGSPH